MLGFRRGAALLGTLLRTPRSPRAPLSSKPPEHQLSAAEQAIALSAMFLSFLGPSAWVLAHVEHYKSRTE